MRGEYIIHSTPSESALELPPRARRIQSIPATSGRVVGTTSACAENTPQVSRKSATPRNYLRVRGEYLTISSTISSGSELPPRARRIPAQRRMADASDGTTSACAENTGHVFGACFMCGNYLRVRGEYPKEGGRLCLRTELPPRARRIPHDTVQKTRKEGTTSACAENTPPVKPV